MAFDPALGDPISEMRFAVGDTQAVELLPDTTYQAVLDRSQQAGQPEPDVAAATRTIAAALAARYAIEPDSISDDGTTITWRKRVDHWTLIAQGKAGGTSAAGGASSTLGAGVIGLSFQEEAEDGC
ncbi:MAG TPA: hypothetical protein VFS21_29840 [Roseiflexaceae bacterium]|nr:hypothetical protein [Roseiflexaceae bacterium]